MWSYPTSTEYECIVVVTGVGRAAGKANDTSPSKRSVIHEHWASAFVLVTQHEGGVDETRRKSKVSNSFARAVSFCRRFANNHHKRFRHVGCENGRDAKSAWNLGGREKKKPKTPCCYYRHRPYLLYRYVLHTLCARVYSRRYESHDHNRVD